MSTQTPKSDSSFRSTAKLSLRSSQLGKVINGTRKRSRTVRGLRTEFGWVGVLGEYQAWLDAQGLPHHATEFETWARAEYPDRWPSRRLEIAGRPRQPSPRLNHSGRHSASTTEHAGSELC